MATVNLGNIKFNWKGTYNAGTTYAIDDVVSYNGSSYICIQASTGNLPTVTTYWNVMSTAGTNGTDVGTTITTQGDILYRDASGLARLGYGTAGQVLQTGGSGANPSWGTVSSDYVKVVSGNATSDFSLQNCFSATYKIYKLELYHSRPASASSSSGTVMRFLGSSNTEISDNYYSTFAHPMSTAGTTSGVNAHGMWSDNRVRLMHNGHDSNASKAGNFEITFFDPFNSSYHTNFNLVGTYMNYGGGQFSAYAGGGTNQNTNYKSTTGLKFYQDASSISNIDYALYGMKV